jgi:hypothetical protein
MAQAGTVCGTSSKFSSISSFENLEGLTFSLILHTTDRLSCFSSIKTRASAGLVTLVSGDATFPRLLSRDSLIILLFYYYSYCYDSDIMGQE